MSKSKHKRTSSVLSNRSKSKAQKDTSIIYQYVKKIDGQQILRKYKKIGLLGRGGFANCYLTQNMDTKKQYATKIIDKEILSSHRTKLRLLNEIKLHKTLHHRNIVELYHQFEDKENVYIFLQLCDNQSLNQLIRARSFLSVPEVQMFLYGIVQGLKYLHSKHVMHRDMKLGNIFLNDKFEVKLGDFGLATKLEFKRECKRTVCGTPNYIAPQVLEGKGYYFQVDIWSIGVILYTFFFGFPPFETEDANSTYVKIRECNYTFPKSTNVPNQAISLIQKILVLNAANRLTLDQILESDFLKLGQGILRELPLICAKRMPNKRQLNELYLKGLIYNNQQYAYKSKSKKEIKLTIEKTKDQLKNNQFIQEFQHLLEDTFYFMSSQNVPLILERGQKCIYQAEEGKYVMIDLKTGLKEELQKSNSYKYLILTQTKSFINEIPEIERQQDPNETPVYVKNIEDFGEGWMFGLSNGTVQLWFEGRSYLVSEENVFQISNGTAKKIDIAKAKSSTQYLKYVRAVSARMKQKEPESARKQIK